MTSTIFELIMGLPASGKSTYAATAAKARSYPSPVVIIDDPKDFYADVVRKIVPGSLHLISDCHLCLPRVRKNAEVRLRSEELMAEFRYVFFENDPEQCLRNLEARMASGDLRTAEEMIKQLSPLYVIPEGVVTIPVWRPA
jgi:hypothetical protein